MAQIIEIDAVDGFTDTVMQLTAVGSDTIVTTATIAAAATNRKTAYGGSFTGLTLQDYEVRLFASVADGGFALSKGVVTVDAADGVFPVYPLSLATIESGIAVLLSRVTTVVATLWANLTAMIIGSGGTAKFTTTAMSNAPAGGGGGSTTISNEDIQEIVAGVTAVRERICDSSGGSFRMTAGDTWIQEFTTTTTGADNFVLAIKHNVTDEDSASVLLVDSVTGLRVVNGAAAGDASDGGIVPASASVTATVESTVTLAIVPGQYSLILKKLDDGSDVTSIRAGKINVYPPGVRETS